MRKQTLLTVAVIGLLVLNFAILSMFYLNRQKQPLVPIGPIENVPPPEKIITERLKLDGAQQQAFEKLKKDHQEKIKSINEDERKLHDELFDLLKEDLPNQTKADSLISLIAENKKKAEQITFNHFADIKKLCTSGEQKELFDEFIDELGKMIGPPGGLQHRPQNPPPPR
jgi:protein CpxP